MATVDIKQMTAEEFYEFILRSENENRIFELDRGEVVEMSRPGELHGVVCFLIVRVLGDYLFRRGRGYVCTNDTGIIVERDPDTVRGPDLMLFDEVVGIGDLSARFAERLPRLIVEVLSPNDRLSRVMRRVTQFLRRGIPLVWIVDPEAQAVSVYRQGQEPYVLEVNQELSGDNVLPDFRCRVAEFFTLPGAQASAQA